MNTNPPCGAKKRGKDETCRGIAMANGRCRLHGGATPVAFGLPQTVTGRHSKYLPTRLLGRYQEAVSDPELLALRDDIGLLDTRIGQVVGALETGESRETWVALMEAASTLEDQWQKLLDDGEPPEEMERTVESIGRLVRSGLSEGYVWSEIRGLLKERSALVASERSRLVELQQYVTSERALLFVHAVMASVKQHVSDRAALAAISADLARLSDVPDGGQSAVPAGVVV